MSGILFLFTASIHGASSFSSFAVYNQAYSENYDADSIIEIIKHARGAYVLLDPFGDGVVEHISFIKSKKNQIGGYISVGTGEDWRDDYQALRPYLSSKEWPEWRGEYFVSETTTGILPIMEQRIDKMKGWGVEWVEFDNMDWLDEESRKKYNLVATEEEAKKYIHSLCNYTHAQGMKCMAKNTVDGFADFDGVTYESYSDNKNWWDKDGMRLFLSQNKPVIIVHYNERNCDNVYRWYKKFYSNGKISFICENRVSKKYKHYTPE